MKAAASDRVTEIVSLLRPERPRRYPESLAGAAAAGDIERMQLFVDRGASLEQPAMGNTTPLAAACAHGRIEAVRWLIARGAQIDQPENQASSPIVCALSKTNCEIAAVLLDTGLPVERAAWGVTAAAALGRLDVVRWLIGRGVDLDKSYPGLGQLRERALRNVKKEGAEDLVRFLKGEVDLGPPPSEPPKTPPFVREQARASAAERPNLLQEAIDLIVAAGKAAANWNATGAAAPSLRQRLLSFAAATGIIEIVAALLDAGASPNSVPEGTPPPLTAAAGEAQVEVMQLLLQRGALANGKDGNWHPLASAAQSGDPEAVKVLLAAGANPKTKLSTGHKMIDYARGPFRDEIRALLEQPAGKGKR